MPASADPCSDEHLQMAIDLLATAVLRRLGREHRLNHPLFTGEALSEVAIGDQTSVTVETPRAGA